MPVATEIDTRLAVFADPLRVAIITLLAAEQQCTCHLVEATGAKQSTVSHHLKVLREARLVATEPCGRFTYYRLRPEAFGELAEHLGDLRVAAEAAAWLRRPC